jgi:ligand-binding SRPBCC domain-containing protein
MRIVIKTPVRGHYRTVMGHFTRELFEQLSPPGAKVDLVRFDGSHRGDVVHLRLKLFGVLEQDWISEITEDSTTPDRAWFVDEGRTLPFFLSQWQHRHVVENIDPEHSLIIDDIRFRSPFWLMDLLLYPVMYAQFAYRRPIYRRFFGSD